MTRRPGTRSKVKSQAPATPIKTGRSKRMTDEMGGEIAKMLRRAKGVSTETRGPGKTDEALRMEITKGPPDHEMEEAGWTDPEEMTNREREMVTDRKTEGVTDKEMAINLEAVEAVIHLEVVPVTDHRTKGVILPETEVVIDRMINQKIKVATDGVTHPGIVTDPVIGLGTNLVTDPETGVVTKGMTGKETRITVRVSSLGRVLGGVR